MTRLAFAPNGKLPDPATAYPAAQNATTTVRYFADPDGRIPIEPDTNGEFWLPQGRTKYWVEVVTEPR